MMKFKLFLVFSGVFTALAVQAEHIEEIIVRGRHETRTIEVAEALVIAPDTAQLLKKAPGANVNGNGPITGIPQYRGMYGPRVAVTLDGAQLAPAGPNWMDPPLSYAAAAQLESLKLYRGIAPVSVAQESIGGAVSAITAQRDFTDSSDFSVNGHLLASGQTVNSGTQLGATVFAVNDRNRLRLATLTERGDDAEFPGGEIIPSEYQRERFDMAYARRIGVHTIDVSYTYSDTGDTGTAALPMDIDFIEGDLFSAGYSAELAQWDLGGKLFYSDLDHGMTNYLLRQPPPRKDLWRRNTTASNNLGFKFSASRQDGSGRWTVGADGLDSVHDSDVDNPNSPVFFVTSFNDAERRTLGVFAEREQDFSGALRAEFGLRANQVKMDAGQVDATPAMMPPGAALRDAFNAADRSKGDLNIDAVGRLWYSVSPETNLYGGVARKSRSPSYQERYLWLPLQATGGLADGYTYTGNLELRPEVAHEVEVGLDFNSDRLSLSPRFFYRDVDDYIQGTPSEVAAARMFVDMMNARNGANSPPPLQFNNIDAEFWGFDMDWSYRFDERLSARGLLNYVRGRRTDAGNDLYRVAPANATLGVDYASGRWGIGIEGVFYRKQDRVSDFNSEMKTGGYSLINTMAWWQVVDSLRIAAGVDNLLDSDYSEHLSGTNRVAGNVDLAQGEKIPGYGINGFVRVDYSF